MNIFDPDFSAAPRIDMYRAAHVPELYPEERQFRVDNWSDEDRESFCGIYKEGVA